MLYTPFQCDFGYCWAGPALTSMVAGMVWGIIVVCEHGANDGPLAVKT